MLIKNVQILYGHTVLDKKSLKLDLCESLLYRINSVCQIFCFTPTFSCTEMSKRIYFTFPRISIIPSLVSRYFFNYIWQEKFKMAIFSRKKILTKNGEEPNAELYSDVHKYNYDFTVCPRSGYPDYVS